MKVLYSVPESRFKSNTPKIHEGNDIFNDVNQKWRYADFSTLIGIKLIQVFLFRCATFTKL